MAAPTPETRVADAINRVLEAEHRMAVAIVEAQNAAQATIDAARDTRRTILDDARHRSLRVHELLRAQVAARLAQLEPAGSEAGPPVDDDLEPAIGAAIAQLAQRLTSDTVA